MTDKISVMELKVETINHHSIVMVTLSSAHIMYLELRVQVDYSKKYSSLGPRLSFMGGKESLVHIYRCSHSSERTRLMIKRQLIVSVSTKFLAWVKTYVAF